ncbi:MAG: hypothetical protein ABFR82_02185 [Nitrospirota bacterium]
MYKIVNTTIKKGHHFTRCVSEEEVIIPGGIPLPNAWLGYKGEKPDRGIRQRNRILAIVCRGDKRNLC